MNNAVQIFNNPDFGQIRTVIIDGEPWFVGKDVAEILGYTNSRKAIIDHVDKEDKRDGVTICDSMGREQIPILINESGLYSLILSSKLPTAKKFKHWVTSEVLPALRKAGHFEIQKEGECHFPTRPLTSDDYIDAARTIAKCHNSRLPIVLDLYRKAGLDVSKIEVQKITPNEADVIELVELLNQHTLTELCKMLDICKTSLYYYRTGKYKPSKERMKKIIETLRK